MLDPFTAYLDRVTNINVVLIGDIGKGKSSVMKTVGAWRQLPWTAR